MTEPVGQSMQSVLPGVVAYRPAKQTSHADVEAAENPASHGVQAPSLTRALKQHVIPSLTLVEPLGQLGLQEKALLDDCVIVQDSKSVQ